MRRAIRWLSVAALGVCASAPVAARAQTAADAPREGASWVDSTLASLTLREKAAQMVWPTILGDFAPEDGGQWRRIREQLERERVGGYTVSVGSPTEIAAKLNAMQRLSRVPLLFGADFEFGAGYRARGGYFLPNAIDLGGATVFPPQMAVGATGDTALAYRQGEVTAREARAMGVHVAYAPILDVNNNAANPVINTRSYGEDPHLVAAMGRNFIRGLQEHGMIATGKHFPGHGDTGVNSHLALPSVNVSRARLDSVELVPFRAAVAADVGAIMSFHGAMPALDASGVPGTLSKKVLTGLLRDEMGFRGLIISDAMDMRGVLDRFGAVEAAKRAVEAGADVLIQPDDVGGMIDAVVAGVGERRYAESRLDASVRRILEAKRRMGLHRRRTVSLDSVRLLVGDSASRSAARAIAERSITLVRDEGKLLPLAGVSAEARVVAVTYARRTDLGAGTTFDAELRSRFPGLRAEVVAAEDAGANYARLLALADSADLVIVSSYMGQSWDAQSVGAPRAFIDFARQVAAPGRRAVLVSFGNPYLVQQLPHVPTYVVAWGGVPASQRAAARALLGRIPFAGQTPTMVLGR
ncbi:MAG TPA: glycoside hydrolase family 3 N-terminal domain-containing protein [Gemmatimonadaceae bacterium]|nr:glycoside hydrolase family 3 N-terminal domain-containing protein [Gemmatimonadaceae bacterium]